MESSPVGKCLMETRDLDTGPKIVGQKQRIFFCAHFWIPKKSQSNQPFWSILDWNANKK